MVIDTIIMILSVILAALSVWLLLIPSVVLLLQAYKEFAEEKNSYIDVKCELSFFEQIKININYLSHVGNTDQNDG